MAVLVMVVPPAARVGMAVMVTDALAPLLMVPRLHVTVPDASLQLPWLEKAEPKVTLAGSVSDSTTPVAWDGPLLVTVTV